MLRIYLSSPQINYPIDSVTFKREDNLSFFVLRSSINNDINITIPYKLPVRDEYLNEDFDCNPFISPTFYKENNIFEVHHTDIAVGRIGWIFPVQSLTSDEHSFADNVHFLRYAFVAFSKLLYGEFFSEDILINVTEIEAELQLSEIYPSDLLVLSLSKEKTKLINGFDIINYLHSFYINKYFICQNVSELNSLEKFDSQADSPRIKVSEISHDLQNEIFITALYKDHLKTKNHPLVQFHLLYQIIELLINRVYDCEMKIIIESTKEAKNNSRSKFRNQNNYS
jgi:hypothetical protein